MISVIAFILISALGVGSRAELACANPRRILAAGGDDAFLSIWDLEEQAQCEIRLEGHSSHINLIAFSRDFRYLFSVSNDKTVAVWNTRTGAQVKTLLGHTGTIYSLEVSRDGSLFASGDDQRNIKIWRTSDLAEARSMKASRGISSLLFSPDGKTLMAGLSDGSIEVFSADTGAKTSSVKPHLNWIVRLLFTPDDKYVISGSDDHSAKKLEYPGLIIRGTFQQHTGRVVGLAINPQGTFLATGSEDNTIILWDLSLAEKKLTLTGHTNSAKSVEFTSDSKYLLSGSWDSTIKVWETATGNPLKSLPFPQRINEIKLAEVCISDSPSKSAACSCGEQLFLTGTAVSNICCEINFGGCYDDSKLFCGKCNAPNYLSSNKCVPKCTSGYWGNNGTRSCDENCANPNEYGDSEDRICKTCDQTCATCSSPGTSESCLSCSSPRFLSTLSCLSACESPYWGNNSTRKCEAACTSSNEYGDAADKRICKKCDPSCATCSGLATSCLSCDPPFYLDLAKCVQACSSPYWGNNSTRKCENKCTNSNEFGDYTDNRICKTCDISCATCSAATPDSCLSCPSPLYLNQGKCLAACLSPLFGNNNTRTCEDRCENPNEYGDTSDRICKTCDPTCATCSSPGTSSSCLSCGSPRYLSGGSCVDTCPAPNWGNNSTRKCKASCTNSNEFGDEKDSRICKSCHPNCKTCTGASIWCTSCNNAGIDFLDLGANSACVSTCTAPYWGDPSDMRCKVSCPLSNQYGDINDNRKCKPCSDRCKTCVGTPTNCTSCPPGPPILYLNLNDKGEQNCVPTCPAPKWARGTGGMCETTCAASTEFGDVNSNRECKACDARKCKTCKDKADYCTSCTNLTDFVLDGACRSSCGDGKFINQVADLRTCEACHSSCLRCSAGTIKDCLACRTGAFLLDGSCERACPAEYFVDDLSGSCKRCQNECVTCFSGSNGNCLSCRTGVFLHNYFCLNRCPAGFYGSTSDNVCKKCSSPCNTCTDAAACSSCEAGTFLDGTNCIKTCPPGKFLDFNTFSCISFCKSGYYLSMNEGKSECGACHYTCKTCFGPLYTDCSTCAENRGDPEGNPIYSMCNCPANTLDYLKPLCQGPQYLSSTIEIAESIQIEEAAKIIALSNIGLNSHNNLFGILFNIVEAAHDIQLYSFLNTIKPLNLEKLFDFLTAFRIYDFLKIFPRLPIPVKNHSKKGNATEIFDQEAPPTFSKRGFTASFLSNASSVFLLTIVIPLLLLLLSSLSAKISLMRAIKKGEKRISRETKIAEEFKKSTVKEFLNKIWKKRNLILINLVFTLLLGSLQELQMFFALQMMNVSFTNWYNRLSFAVSVIWLIYEVIIILYTVKIYLSMNPKVKDKINIIRKIKSLIEKKNKKLKNASTPEKELRFDTTSYEVEKKERYSFFFEKMIKEDAIGMSFFFYRIAKKAILPLLHVFFHLDINSTLFYLIIFYAISFLYLRIAEPYKFKIISILAEFTDILHINFLLLLKFYVYAIDLKNSEIALALGIFMIYSILAIICASALSLIIGIGILIFTFIADFLKKNGEKHLSQLKISAEIEMRNDTQNFFKNLGEEHSNKRYINDNAFKDKEEDKRVSKGGPIFLKHLIEYQEQVPGNQTNVKEKNKMKHEIYFNVKNIRFQKNQSKNQRERIKKARIKVESANPWKQNQKRMIWLAILITFEYTKEKERGLEQKFQVLKYEVEGEEEPTEFQKKDMKTSFGEAVKPLKNECLTRDVYIPEKVLKTRGKSEGVLAKEMQPSDSENDEINDKLKLASKNDAANRKSTETDFETFYSQAKNEVKLTKLKYSKKKI